MSQRFYVAPRFHCGPCFFCRSWYIRSLGDHNLTEKLWPQDANSKVTEMLEEKELLLLRKPCRSEIAHGIAWHSERRKNMEKSEHGGVMPSMNFTMYTKLLAMNSSKGENLESDAWAGTQFQLSPRYSHKYPYDWRSKQPVITRATPQWFWTQFGPFRDESSCAEMRKYCSKVRKHRWTSFQGAESDGWSPAQNLNSQLKLR